MLCSGSPQDLQLVVLSSHCLMSPEKKTTWFLVVLPAGWISSLLTSPQRSGGNLLVVSVKSVLSLVLSRSIVLFNLHLWQHYWTTECPWSLERSISELLKKGHARKTFSSNWGNKTACFYTSSKTAFIHPFSAVLNSWVRSPAWALHKMTPWLTALVRQSIEMLCCLAPTQRQRSHGRKHLLLKMVYEWKQFRPMWFVAEVLETILKNVSN